MVAMVTRRIYQSAVNCKTVCTTSAFIKQYRLHSNDMVRNTVCNIKQN